MSSFPILGTANFNDTVVEVDRSDGRVLATIQAGQAMPTLAPNSLLLDIVHPSDHATARRILRETGHGEMVRIVADAKPQRAFLVAAATTSGRAAVRFTIAADLISVTVDPLTGLANREAALSRLNRVTPGDSAVMFCDLDGFKEINDTHGHDVGDHVLRQVAARFTDVCTPDEFIARLGGDEFLIICRNVTSQHDAEARARRFRDQLRAPFHVEDAVLWGADVSIGICLADAGMTPETMLWNADIAMYEAKRLKVGVTLFTDSLNTASRERRQLEHDLRSAAAKGQLYTVYQPVLDLTSRRIVGCEALLRWNHPQRGEVSPTTFVPLAEQLGIVGQLGDIALNSALAQLRAWIDADPDTAPRFIAVNVSAQQLTDPNFADSVHQALIRAGIPGERLTLEITETALLADPDTAISALMDLSDLNIQFDIDDFGTGYSNLSYLVRLPVHALKVDRSFTWSLLDDDRTQVTVRALLTLARELGMHVITEGVETAEQLEWLADHHCAMAQGFHISRPVDGDTLFSLLQAQAPQRHVKETGDTSDTQPGAT